MCVNKDSHDIKLVDFGLARELSGSEQVKSSFGTPDFVGTYNKTHQTLFLFLFYLFYVAAVSCVHFYYYSNHVTLFSTAPEVIRMKAVTTASDMW